ncbi:hypothetical protein ARMSODRAFT_975004 [Armillaria solidipes]|uniref:Uncharacterized protein n=1 Tax=Armillaria solidipes TaxID=1076256 RepID=A0A2H3BZC3_9AGAR|nr:hypothetical protein ARMSODRAFT_975004 [Armillaria solidipes]
MTTLGFEPIHTMGLEPTPYQAFWEAHGRIKRGFFHSVEGSVIGGTQRQPRNISRRGYASQTPSLDPMTGEMMVLPDIQRVLPFTDFIQVKSTANLEKYETKPTSTFEIISLWFPDHHPCDFPTVDVH